MRELNAPFGSGMVWLQQQVEDVEVRARKLVPAFDKTQGCLLPRDNEHVGKEACCRTGPRVEISLSSD